MKRPIHRTTDGRRVIILHVDAKHQMAVVEGEFGIGIGEIAVAKLTPDGLERHTPSAADVHRLHANPMKREKREETRNIHTSRR